jgi:hypothetical protein
MRRALLGGVLALWASGASAANQTIDQLVAGAALGGTELLPMFQTANPAVTTTPNALQTYLSTAPVTFTSAANPSTSTLTLTGATALTTSHPVLNMTQTWVTVGTTYTGMILNVTNTASAAASLLMDLQVGGASKFSVREDGLGTFAGAISAVHVTTGAYAIVGDTAGAPGGATLYNGGAYSWSSTGAAGGSPDTALSRSAAGVVEVNNGTTGAYIEAKMRSLVIGGTPPTFTGSCTAPSAQAGGNTSGTFTVGAAAACAAGTYIMTFAFTAPTGWACQASDRTVTTNTIRQTASSGTTATFLATTSNNEVVSFS